MRTAHTHGTFALALFAWLFAGCQGGTEESGKKTASNDDSPRDACALITAAEVAAITGLTVVPTAEAGSSATACAYVDPKTTYHQFGIDVSWSGGRTEWQQWNAARDGATRMLEREEKDVDVDEIVKPGPVEGLGDRASYNGLMGGFVLKGDTLLWFRFGILPEPERYFRPLARKALEKV